MEVTLEKFIELIDGQFTNEECEKYYIIWEGFNKDGQKLLDSLSKYLQSIPQSLSLFFPAPVAVTEMWFDKNFPACQSENYKKVSPIAIALYDLLLSLKRSYEAKSAISCALITRTILEARINLEIINQDPHNLLLQFETYKEVARLWNEYKTEKISQSEVHERMKSYSIWYDEDWKTLKKKISSWTGVENDNLARMSERVGLSGEYESLYRLTSKFTHISPLIGNYYSVNGNGPVCSEQGTVNLVFSGLTQYFESLASLWKIVSLDHEEIYISLHIPSWIYVKENKLDLEE